MLAMLLMGNRPAIADNTASRVYAIAPQPVGTALKEFAAQSHMQLIFSENDVGHAQTAGVRGKLAPSEALSVILRGTGLGFELTPNHVVVVRRKADVQHVGPAATPTSNGSAAPNRKQGQDGSKKGPSERSLAQVDQGEAASDVAPDYSKDPSGRDERDSVPLEEVVVTAQKREERLIDVPQAVSVISADALSKLGATQFIDFATSVPGVNFTTAGAGFTQISMRGVTTGSDIGPTTAIYIDDVPYGAGGNFTLGGQLALDPALFDLDRIEVLHGPQGTLYGASAMGGLIKYVTKQPSATAASGDAEAGLSGTADGGGINYIAAAGVNLPIKAGEAALRASGYESHEGGYIDNIELNQHDVNRSNTYGGRADLLLTPTDALSLRLVGFAQNISRDGEATADYDFNGVPITGPLEQSRPAPEPFTQRFRLVSGTINWNFGPASLTSISSYQTVNTDWTWAFSGLSVPAVSQTDKVAQEVRLESRGKQTLEWIIGAFYTHEKSSLGELGYLTPQTPVQFFTYLAPSTYQEYAGFGDLIWHLTDKFDVTGGLRSSHDREVATQNGTGAISSQPRTASEENVVTYLADARYHLNRDSIVYVRYATGYRPGGPNYSTINTITLQPITPAPFKSDRLQSYEAGYKVQTRNGRFALDVDAYQINWGDIQVSTNVNGESGIANAPGGATIKGAELAITARPVNGLTLSYAGAYTDAYINRADASLGARAGERLPITPRLTSALSGDYTLTTGGLSPTFGTTVTHVSDRTTSFDRSTSFTQYHLPAYTTLDLRAGLTFGAVTTQLYVHNVTDQRTQLSLMFAQFGGRVAIGQPRTIGVMATTDF